MSDTILQFTPHAKPISSAMVLAQIEVMAAKGVRPFSADIVAMLSDLSRRLLKSPLARTAPQLTVAGYWLRGAALKKLVSSWQERLPSDCIAAPRGVAFHLPPANVDTLFLYSWALAVLAGNCNVVRLPSALTPIGEAILAEICGCLADHSQLDRHLFVHFDHGGPLAAAFSAKSDLRMIWGGDAKVADASRHIMRPDGISLGFPDRFSFAAINARSWLELDHDGKVALAGQIYNDMFWFDQLGCGSPRILYWVGNQADGEAAAAPFFELLDQVITQKAYESEVGTAIAKFAWASKKAAQGDLKTFERVSNALMVFEPNVDADLHGDVQGGGMLAQMIVPDLETIAPRVRRKDQTMTHFGFSKDALRAFAVQASTQGLCRIVPIGEALNFEPVWDGIDLLSAMTRLVTIRF